MSHIVRSAIDREYRRLCALLRRPQRRRGVIVMPGGGGRPLGDKIVTVGTSGQYGTIAAGITACPSGGIVLVLPGTYAESGLSLTSNRTLLGLDPKRTKIEATPTGNAISVNPLLSTAAGCAVIGIDFHIPATDRGLCIRTNGANNYIRNCRFGGGIELVDFAGIATGGPGTSWLVDCELYEPNASLVVLESEGSVDSKLFLLRNRVTGSTVDNSGDGITDTAFLEINTEQSLEIWLEGNNIDWTNAQASQVLSCIRVLTGGTASDSRLTLHSRNNRVVLTASGGGAECYGIYETVTGDAYKAVIDSTDDYFSLSGATTAHAKSSTGSSSGRGGSLTVKGSNITSVTNYGLASDNQSTIAGLNTSVHRIGSSTIRRGDGTSLTAGAVAGNFRIADAGIGVGGQTLDSENANNNTKLDTIQFLFSLPLDYLPGSAVTLRVRAKIVQGGNAPVTKTLDAEAWEIATDGTVGSDLCATSIQTLTTSFADYDFTITPTGLAPGNQLQCYIQGNISEAGAAGNNYISIGSVELRTTAR